MLKKSRHFISLKFEATRVSIPFVQPVGLAVVIQFFSNGISICFTKRKKKFEATIQYMQPGTLILLQVYTARQSEQLPANFIYL